MKEKNETNSTGLSGPVYDYLLEMILTKKFKPGEKIAESKLSKQFNVSRTPIREALRQLANEGLVEIYPNRFVKVSNYSDKTIQDIGVMRIALETMAIKLAMLFGSKSDFLTLRKIAETCHSADDDYTRKRLDCDFHLALVNISKNDLLIKYQNELYLRVRFILSFKNNEKLGFSTDTEQHIEIVDALIDGNEEKAISLISEHLSSFYNLEETYPKDFFN